MRLAEAEPTPASPGRRDRDASHPGDPATRVILPSGAGRALAWRERRDAHLESVLGATPRGFESRILRHADQTKRQSWQPTRGHLVFPVVSFGGLNYELLAVPPPGSAAAIVPGHGRRLTGPNGAVHAAEACWEHAARVPVQRWLAAPRRRRSVARSNSTTGKLLQPTLPRHRPILLQ
jgi:hypothetical protein